MDKDKQQDKWTTVFTNAMDGTGTSEVRDEDVHLSLAPYLQTYLAHNGRGSAGTQRRLSGCCPALFERASHAWWNPHFDSEILEGQYCNSSFPQIKLRFQCGLLYLMFVSIAWCVYFAVTQTPHWYIIVPVLLTLLILLTASLLVSHTKHFQYHYRRVSFVIALSACVLSLLFIIPETGAYSQDITPVGLFSLCIEILLILYTVIPLQLYLCVTLGVTYSVAFETLNVICMELQATEIIIRAILHVCVHVIGIHILVMTTVRMRGTFMRVGQSLLVRQQLEMEKQLKEKMILSVMPPKVADWLLKEGHNDENAEEEVYYDDESGSIIRKVSSPRSSNTGDIRSLFRPFNMHCMNDVSILFADIVGFTRMSSNKTAEQLVGLLNDLFERFDDLCVRNGCEKISTLGDCYYCVSGCPEPRKDHAACCVEMGLAMIDAIHSFDQQRNEDVNMRVGVHTGTVLCGIVGTRRFKFDVWSNDVTLANRMESTGQPGKVHISHVTLGFLENAYMVKEAEPVQDMRTYFIEGRTKDVCKTPVARGSALKATSLPSILDAEQEVEEAQQGDDDNLRTIDCQVSTGLRWKLTTRNHPPRCESETNVTQPLTEEESTHIPAEVAAQKDQLLSVPAGNEDGLSITPSINSRKDSGIRSNSRRSSIQQQVRESTPHFCMIYAMNGLVQSEMLTHRVSGYYTSSQPSLNDPDTREYSLCPRSAINIDCNSVSQMLSGLIDATLEGMMELEEPEEGLGYWSKLRKLSDLQMIRCVQAISTDSTDASYFSQPPLGRFSLFFQQEELEKEYRQLAHRSRDNDPLNPPLTLASPRYNTYLDLLVSALVFILVGVSLSVLLGTSHPGWFAVWLPSSLLYLCVAAWCLRHMLFPSLLEPGLRWYPWHILGAVLLSLPVLAVLANFQCGLLFSTSKMQPYCLLVFIGLIHYCNFTQLNCWMKSALASLAALVFVVLVASPLCLVTDSEVDAVSNTTSLELGEAEELFRHEVYMDVLLLVCLVWFLNREFEISYRLSFHGNAVAARDKAKVQATKNQVDWLLHNIIPQHVAEQLKSTARYSENHKMVGIIFASIVNFNEMYDESYLGGREYLRVLNELIGDFDELLHRSQFQNIEKIKTIGSTYMAASGLNPTVRARSSHEHQHLLELIEFARELQKVVDDFNKELLEFKLILRVGYNHGDVTAGVIGTTKLYYDIWGDAVNIASRMDSTGVREHIQLGESCLPVLQDRYNFELRGSIYVKGKDNMNVYLLKGPKES
ncbi:hypothetical protein B566_EDAN004847 [Ephemera danica]|nr:hypothetical protein B566_EDAN004847 [Ephemera danica]